MIRPTRRLAAIALPLCLLFAAPAAATTIGKSGGLLYVSQYGTIPASSGPPTDGGVSTFCPKSYTAVGGGASAGGSPAKTFISSNTNQTDRSWHAQAWHVDAPKIKLKAFGICSKSTALTRDRHLSSVGTGPTVGYGTETCPSGDVISGGVLTIGAPSSWYLNSSSPKLENSWEVYEGYTGASPASLLTDVVCTDGKAPTRVEKDVPLGAAAVVTSKRSCAHGKPVEGGGGYISGSSREAHILASRPYDGGDKDKVPDDGWQVKARNDAGAAKTLTVEATCKS